MPIIKSAKKAARQADKRHAKNLRVKRAFKEAEKTFMKKPTFEALRALQSEVDTMVKKNLMEKNTAALRMKKFSAVAKAAGVKIVAVKKAAKPSAKTTETAKTVKTTAKPAAKKTATATSAKKAPAKKPAAKKATVAKK
jgi:DNA-binding protein HU-beta